MRQVLVEAAQVVVLRQQQHGVVGAGAADVGGDEAEDVAVAEVNGLVDLRLVLPGRVVAGVESL